MTNMEVRSEVSKTVVRLFEDRVEIEWLVGFGQVHRKGTKRIPLGSISAVQFKPYAFLSAGFIQFTIPGGREGGTESGRFPRQAAKDENAILF